MTGPVIVLAHEELRVVLVPQGDADPYAVLEVATGMDAMGKTSWATVEGIPAIARSAITLLAVELELERGMDRRARQVRFGTE